MIHTGELVEICRWTTRTRSKDTEAETVFCFGLIHLCRMGLNKFSIIVINSYTSETPISGIHRTVAYWVNCGNTRPADGR